MRVEKIFFNTEDNVELFGLLHTSESKNDKEVVIAIHGMGSNCFKQRDDIIAQKLTSNNISYFSFNNRGFGLVNKITKDGSGILQAVRTIFGRMVHPPAHRRGRLRQLRSRGGQSGP